MKAIAAFLMSLLAAGLLGCGRQQQPRHIVILPDVSGSIDRSALEQAFKAIDELVGHLQRGDRIAIIPILGDAQAEASGRIIQFEVPKERRAYDTDLRDFRRKLRTSLAEMQGNAATHPGAKTDILGSIELADQEFQLVSGQYKRVLIILSDFIQEDDGVNFRNDNRLANQTGAETFATQLFKVYPFQMAGVQVSLGLLRSKEYIRLRYSRREALRSFWTKYFLASGTSARFVIDGTGLLDTFRL
ncbi:MAG TPA: hypothetical protein VKY85_14490 [Candidatus Angelobacter sp.]|nr:hypothetical protein [Candidatus Angelobacter sp.]